MHDHLDSLVAAVAADHHGVFGAAHLRALGVAEHERRYRLLIGRWSAVHERVYRIAGAPRTWRGDVMAACWAGGTRAVASHRSAAELWELPGRTQAVVEITCPRWRRAQHDGLVVHESRALSELDITTVDGIPVTTVARTLFDLAAVRRSLTVDLAIDNALRRELTDVAELRTTRDRLARRGRRGSQSFRQLVADRSEAERPTESERERLLLRMLERHGFEAPVRQFEIFDDTGTFVARPDFAYPARKIAIEYDSYQEHTGKIALVRDSARRNAMVALGWAPITATQDDLRRGGDDLAAALRRALTRRTSELASK